MLQLCKVKQGCNHVKFERPLVNSVHQKANSKMFVKSENMPIISFEYMQKEIKSGTFIICLTYLTILQSFNFSD